MANMSYCRFENTLEDLQDCFENFGNAESESEKKAEEKLIELCKDIAEENVK